VKKCVRLRNNFISVERISRYKNLDEYFENLKLSKNYYIPLSIVEISLRNSLDKLFKNNISKEWLQNKQFIKPQHKHKIDISIKLLAIKDKEIIHHNILAELTFGFFVTFFKQPYSQYLRFNDLKQIFPNLPSSKSKKINRHFIFTKLNKIRLFRNKVFHHDKIINKKEYKTIEDELYEILNYFNDKIASAAKELNNSQGQ